MGVPGLQCSTKYQVTKRADGSTVTKNNSGTTFKEWASRQVSTTSNAKVFSSTRNAAPTKIYASGADSRLGKYGYEKGPDGQIRSNANYAALRQHTPSVIKPITINVADACGGTSSCSSTPKASAMEQILAAGTAGVALYKQLDDLGAIDAAKDGVKSLFSKLPSNSDGVLSNKLDDAKNFTEIGTLEKQAETKKTNLNSDYQKLNPKETFNEAMNKEGVQEGLKLANANLDTSKLELSELNPDDLEASEDAIKKDIDNVKEFQDKDIKDAKSSVSEKKGEIKGSIEGTQKSLEQLKAQKTGNAEQDAALETKIQQMETKLKQLKEQQKQIDAAETAIKEAETNCKQLVEDLKGQKDAIKDLKEFEGELKDAKYDMAKEQDEKLGKDMKKIDNLNKKAMSLKGTDEKTQAKRAEINSEIAELKSEIRDLAGSLNDAGVTSFENSKGKKYDVKNLASATTYTTAGGDVTAGLVKDMMKNGTIKLDENGQVDVAAMQKAKEEVA